MVQPARLSESENVREDEVTVFIYRIRVPCNARLNLRRSPRNLFRARVQLYEQRPRGVDFLFRLVISESAQAREDAAAVSDTGTRVPTPTPFPSNPSLKSRTAPHPAPENPQNKQSSISIIPSRTNFIRKTKKRSMSNAALFCCLKQIPGGQMSSLTFELLPTLSLR